MKKGLLLLAPGFEIVEALASADIVRRSKVLGCDLVSISQKKEVASSMGSAVIADALLSQGDAEAYSFLILPGGKRGVENLKGSKDVLDLVRRFFDEGKGVYAICAAPSILGELGILDGKNYTCFPGFQKGNGHYVNAPFVEDGSVITGHSMAYTIPFAEAIVKKEAGEEALEATFPGTRGL